MKIKPITTKRSFGGFDYTIIERVGNVALVIQQQMHKPSSFARWEVWIIRTGKPHPNAYDFDSWDLVERGPSSETWGTYGWTYQTEDEARVRFNQCFVSSQAILATSEGEDSTGETNAL